MKRRAARHGPADKDTAMRAFNSFPFFENSAAATDRSQGRRLKMFFDGDVGGKKFTHLVPVRRPD